jgi:hypothetical protein
VAVVAKISGHKYLQHLVTCEGRCFAYLTGGIDQLEAQNEAHATDVAARAFDDAAAKANT